MSFGSLKGGTGSSSLKGTGYKNVISKTFTPEQSKLFKQLFGNVGPDSQLAKLAGGDQSQFEQYEQPALQQFNAIQGNIASRFSGAGGSGGRQAGLGARHSSGFQNDINQSASDFASQLKSQRMGLQRQALLDLMGISNSLLGQQPYQQNFIPQQPEQPGFWKSILGGALPIAGAGIGAAFGGLPGAQLGGSLGAAAGKGFGGY